ncbi:MAG TPA: DNA repair protein RecN [Prochlorococcus sp.]
MLIGLRLQNIALIDALELSFERGFTVLTGETGAGKSILLDALDALLGGAQGTSGVRLLRVGVDRGQIEASFALNSAIESWLKQQEFDLDEPELVLSREWRRQDNRVSSRYRLNGVAVNRQQMLALRPLLIDLTVQGQTQQLSRPGQQRHWLDCFGGVALQNSLGQVQQSWRSWQQIALKLEQAQVNFEQLQRQRQDEQMLLEELELAQLDDPHEDKNLRQEQDRLVHGVRLQEGLALLIGRMHLGADQVPSVLEHLAACVHELQAMALLDSSLTPQRDQCLDLEAGLQDLMHQLEKYGSYLESDPERLAQLQERLASLKRLEIRFRLDLSQLLARRDDLRNHLAIGGAEADLDKIQQDEYNARKLRDRANQCLTVLRKKMACQLEQTLMGYLQPMGLANVRFEVQLNPALPSEHGADAVQFLFSANPGQPLAPLAEVASGGEMSRFLLALKTTLSAVDGSSTLLFDEIDAGVSGRVSRTIASLLKDLSLQRQVFCVTHQPLVAAAADHHFCVSKSVEKGVTRSRVSHLRDTQARMQELADLAGGDLAEARAYAAGLLDQQVA